MTKTKRENVRHRDFAVANRNENRDGRSVWLQGRSEHIIWTCERKEASGFLRGGGSRSQTDGFYISQTVERLILAEYPAEHPKKVTECSAGYTIKSKLCNSVRLRIRHVPNPLPKT